MPKTSSARVVAKEQQNDWMGTPHVRLDLGTTVGDPKTSDCHVYVKQGHPLASLKVGAHVRIVGKQKGAK